MATSRIMMTNKEWDTFLNEATNRGLSPEDAVKLAQLVGQVPPQAPVEPKPTVSPALALLLALTGQQDTSKIPTQISAEPQQEPSASTSSSHSFRHFFQGPTTIPSEQSSTSQAQLPGFSPRKMPWAGSDHSKKPRSRKQPMSRLLASHRAQVASAPPASSPASPSVPPSPPLIPVPEKLLLRDIVYILQGIDGQFVRFRPAPPPNQGPRRTFARGEIVVDENKEAEPKTTPTPAIERTWQDGIEFVLGPVVEGQPSQGEWSIAAPTRVLLHTLAELGWLYRLVDKRIAEAGSGKTTMMSKGKERDGGRGGTAGVVGMVEQSLHAALKDEMTDYFRLVAELEVQLGNEDLLDDDDGHGQLHGHDRQDESRGEGGNVEDLEGGMTLRRLLVWTEDVKLRMRLMATLVEEAGGDNVGGALLTSLHARTSNGDPFIRTVSSRLLKTLSVPFFATLASWIYQGELRDPFGEFFVALNPALGDRPIDGGASPNNFGSWSGNGAAGDYSSAAGPGASLGSGVGGTGMGGFGDEYDDGTQTGRVQAHELWEGKFTFRREMLPGFLEESFGRKIFSTGKSLNFMKYSCQDAAWVARQTQIEGQTRTLQYSDMVGLERSISLAYSMASQRLFDIFFDKFRLMDHLKALKDYLMLGKGDFVEILMESLGPSLDRPANLLYRHNLTATLETALRGSTSASEHPDTLRRLDARMLEFTQGEIGWDVFTLEYKVDAPLDTVLDPQSMQGYTKMFKHLWQIKRVEYALNGVQRRLMTGARTFLRVPELAYDFHHTRISLQQMLFFIRQLQYYCHLEVIGCSWQALEEFAFKKEGDLDSLIEAHKAFLERLVTKALLMNARKSSKRDNVSMLEQVRAIFRMMLQYKSAAETLCNFALAEASRQESARDPKRGINSLIPPRPESRFEPEKIDQLAGIRDRLEEYHAEFRALAVTLVAQLGQAPDLDMRFLAVRLNFNFFFSNTTPPSTSSNPNPNPNAAIHQE